MRFYKYSKPFVSAEMPCVVLNRDETNIFARDGIKCALRADVVALAKSKMKKPRPVAIYDHQRKMITFLTGSEICEESTPAATGAAHQ